MRAGLQPVPLQVQMIISDLCNHSCSFCAYRMDGYTSNEMFGEEDPITHVVNNNPNRMIPYEKVLEILQDCKEMGVKAIQYTGGGEPTVHPKHKEIFERTLDLGLDLALVSNGTVLREGVPEILARGSWVRFSVDAGTKESYSSIRKVPESYFQRTLDNIKRVVQTPGRKAIVGVGFVVTRENFTEIKQAAEICRDLGVDNLRISAVFTPDDFEYHRTIYPFARDLAREVEQLSTPTFKVFNLFGDRVQDLVDQRPEYEFCSYMHLNTYIGGDQNVYTCCNNAYSRHGFMGSLRTRSFKDFWNSSVKKELYAEFKASSCERCMFNNKNRFANYLLEKNPTHVNYV